jgi:uncharacterized membrane protein YwaF
MTKFHFFPVSCASISDITLWLLARSVRAACRSRVLTMFVWLLAAAKWSKVDPDEPTMGAEAGKSV